MKVISNRFRKKHKEIFIHTTCNQPVECVARDYCKGQKYNWVQKEN